MNPRLKLAGWAIATVLACLPASGCLLNSTAIVMAQTQQERRTDALQLNREGQQLQKREQFQAALKKYQQALEIVRELGDRRAEGVILNNIGEVYRSLGQYPKALESYQRALAIHKEVGNRSIEATTLNNLGAVYSSQGQYAEALGFYQQALTLARELNDRPREATALNNIGLVYDSQDQSVEALEFYQQALVLHKQLGDHAGEGVTLNNMGLVYIKLGQYPKALEFYQQALAIAKESGDRPGEGTTLSNLGEVYRSLGQYVKALEFYQQALAIHREVRDQLGEGTTLNNIGLVYIKLGQYRQALKFYEQALAIAQQVDTRQGKGGNLNNIGAVYSNQGKYDKALEVYQQALALDREIGNRAGEGITLNNIGLVYSNQGKDDQALEVYQQALAIHREVGNRSGEGTTLNNLGFLLKKQTQLDLAIVFLKQAVNTYESIRGELRTLSKEQQESYTKTVADTYRQLADLLLKQDRVLEAQRVLDLLKVQELDDYLSTVRGNSQTTAGIERLPREATFWKNYDAKLARQVQLGQQLATLNKLAKMGSLTPEQAQQRSKIETEQRNTTREFLDFLRQDRIDTVAQQLRHTTGGENLDPKLLRNLQENLRELQQDVVVLYPLVLDDRLELLLATPYTPPIRRPVPVSRTELNQTILDYRRALLNPAMNPKPLAQKLYTWLIQPLEPALKEAKTKTILYAPDGQLRYVPLAALYDGQRWLAQRFTIDNITALSLTDLGRKPRPGKILAAAYTQQGREHTVSVGDRKLPFTGLKFAGAEVDTLSQLLPDTTKLIDDAFSLQSVLQQMSRYSIIHLATHAAFLTGQPEDSFILFGNGDRATFRDVETWNLPNTDLVVLSACETGLGGELGDGREILGFGYLMQQTQARASISTLWEVDDGGTQALMTAFYAGLKQGMTKAQALQAAQIALITNDYTQVGGGRGLGIVGQRGTPVAFDRLSHPYYWAPFILIGNGL